MQILVGEETKWCKHSRGGWCDVLESFWRACWNRTKTTTRRVPDAWIRGWDWGRRERNPGQLWNPASLNFKLCLHVAFLFSLEPLKADLKKKKKKTEQPREGRWVIPQSPAVQGLAQWEQGLCTHCPTPGGVIHTDCSMNGLDPWICTAAASEAWNSPQWTLAQGWDGRGNPSPHAPLLCSPMPQWSPAPDNC